MTLTASQILAITIPEKLFSSPEAVKIECSRLRRIWHPDLNRSEEAPEVFKHITKLYKEACVKIENKSWEKPGVLLFHDDTGRDFEIGYIYRHIRRSSEQYIGRNLVTTRMTNIIPEAFDQALKMMAKMKIPSSMESKFKSLVPVVRFKDKNKTAVVLNLPTPDVVVLRDAIAYCGGSLPIEHAAWVTTRLLNLVCIFNYSGFAHNGISENSVFIDPKTHAAYLLDDWMCAKEFDGDLKFIFGDLLNLLPDSSVRNKKSVIQNDLSLIRALLLKMLGVPSGKLMGARKSLHPEIIRFVKLPPSSNPVDDLTEWEKSLKIMFPARKFTNWDLDRSKVYASLSSH